MTMILACTCSAIYQDATYGKGNRVHNPLVKEGMFRCTICSNERGKPSKGEPAKKSDKKLGK